MQIVGYKYNIGNRLKTVSEGAAGSIYGFVKPGSSSSEYSYNRNGSMKYDYNSGIAYIGYNFLNLPEKITFRKGHVTEYTYDALGEKRQVKHITVRNQLAINMGDAGYVVDKNNELSTLKTDYCAGGSIIYEGYALKMIRTEEGYLTKSGSQYSHHFYIKDHLGNNRAVVCPFSGGSWLLEQEMNYYPFGMSYPTGNYHPEKQPYKFGDKELDEMHGLNWYDQGARMFGSILPITSTPDPMAEKYYSMSPYCQMGNNPVNRIDPTGRDDYYYNEKGIQIYCLENQSPDRNYVIKTTQTTDAMYNDKTSSPNQRGKVQSITSEVAAIAESEISTGNLTGDHMKNVVQIQSTDKMEAMINSIKDDGTGGTTASNNKEYSGSFGGKKGVYNIKESNAGKPSEGKPLVTTGTNDFHSHPSGTEKVSRGTAFWQQPPSKQDISVAGNKNEYVVGMGNGTIYIYNNKGVIATIPISIFK